MTNSGATLTDGYLTFADLRDDRRYVHFLRHDGVVYGEVGSFQRTKGDPCPPQASETALGCLGFATGAGRLSYSRDNLAPHARRLACLAELLFGAAYGGTEDLTVVALTRSSREVGLRHLRVVNA